MAYKISNSSTSASRMQKMREKNPWNNVIPIPGISGFHIIQAKGKGVVSCRTHSISNENIIFRKNISPYFIPDEDLVCGKWILVNYEEKLYPGEITKREENGMYIVNVMEESKIRGYFKWPKHRDYTREDIVKVISAPVAANRRGTYKLIDL